MSILNKIKSYEFDKNTHKILGIKSPIVWGHLDGGAIPIFYIRKPKSMSQKDFEEIIEHLDITIKK